MSEQFPSQPLNPEQAADYSGDLYKDHTDLAESFETYDRMASKSAERVARDELRISETGDKETIESRQRILSGNQRDLEITAGQAYSLKLKLAENLQEATSLALSESDALHEAALASAKLHGIDIVEPTKD